MRSVAVAAGGVIGTLARWWVEGLFPPTPPGFPWGTLLVNVSGAFALGLVGTILMERVAHTGHLRTFLGIGLFGSYTTFSTMALEGVLLIEAGRVVPALVYWVITLLAGQAAGVYGMWVGRLEVPLGKEAA